MRTKLAVTETQLASTEEDVKRRQEREDKREADLAALNTQLQHLTRTCDTMTDERERRAVQVSADTERTTHERQDLEVKLSAAEDSLVQLKAQVVDTEELLKVQANTLTQTTSVLEEKGHVLEAKLLQLQQLKETADTEHTMALHALSEETESQRAAKKILESEKKELRNDKKMLESEKKDLESEKTQLVWKVESLEDKVADVKVQLTALEQQLEERRKLLLERESEKEEARMQVVRLQAERVMQESKLQESKSKLDDKDELIKAKDVQIKDKDAQIKDAIKAVQQVQDVSLERSKEVTKEREALLHDLQGSKDDLMQMNRELDSQKKGFTELETQSRNADDELSKNAVELESLRADLAELTQKLDKVVKEKSSATERLAVVEAEYRTYKNVCNTPTKLADQLNKLVSLEADRASVQSRLFEAEEDADSNKTLVMSLKDQVKDLKQKIAKADSTRRKLHNELQELKGNIRVFARVRPADERNVLSIDDENGSVLVPHNATQTTFRFDRAFTPRSSQDDVFAEVSHFVQSALDGYNVSLFAYGQTGSGKTHTMFGTGTDTGIIPRSIAQILQTVEEQKENNWEYHLEASFLEIYQEQVFDLLCAEPEREGKKYTIVAGENGRHDVTDLEWRPVRSHEDVELMLEASQCNKHVARTDMNERSSRSHTVFSLRISGQRSAAGGQVQTLHGTLHLVDLAGSERLAKSHATGDRLKETQSINKSLSAMSDVFVAISKHQHHVPYRNSKLTFLLQPCLSGDGKALMIANCSPIESSSHETLCTLRFASMVSSCELGKATKHIGSSGADKNPNNSLASHVSSRCNDSMQSLASVADGDVSLDLSISSICTNASTATARSSSHTASARRAVSARGEASDVVRPSTRRTAAAPARPASTSLATTTRAKRVTTTEPKS